MLIALGCDPVEYDFSYDASPPDPGPSGTICQDLEVATADCQELIGGDAGCLDEIAVSTEVIVEPAGCTVADLPLGIVSFEIPAHAGDEFGLDIFAWAAGPEGGPGPFDDSASLGLFDEQCSDDPFLSEGEPACDGVPFIAKQAVAVGSELFLHVETTDAAEAVIEYQIRATGEWIAELPTGGEPVSCAYQEQLSDAIVGGYSWWLPGPPIPVEVAEMAPVWGSAPWICSSSSAGWRQVGFHLYQSEDVGVLVRVTRVHVRDPQSGQPVDYHFAIYQCNSGGEADPNVPGPLVWDCNDEGDHPSKEFDVTLDPWGGWNDFETNYVLVLQVPPNVGPSVELEFEAEVL